MTSHPPDIAKLIEAGPEAVLRVVEANKANPKAINLELIRFVANNKAVSDLDRTDKLSWATVALRACEILYSTAPSPEFRYQYSSIRLRSWLISQLGEVRQHPILDLQTVLDWFAELVTGWDVEFFTQSSLADLDIRDMRTGRNIKNALHALDPIIEDPRFAYAPGIQLVKHWFRHKGDLP